MPSVLSHPTTSTSSTNPNIWKRIRKHLNFYRIHILFFIFTPLIFSGIFYASNGRYKISYIDALFNCVSAMTVCGLATVNLSSLTGWQQAILFTQMCIGNPVIVSWVIVFTRKYYFAKKFQHIIEAESARKAASLIADAEKKNQPWPSRIATFIRQGRGLSVVAEETETRPPPQEKGGHITKLRPDMIRRMDDAPKLINPSGWVSEGKATSMRREPSVTSQVNSRSTHGSVRTSASNELFALRARSSTGNIRRLSDPGTLSRPQSPNSAPMHRYETVGVSKAPMASKNFPRTQTVEFAVPNQRSRFETSSPVIEHPSVRPAPDPTQTEHRSLRRQSLTMHPSMISQNTHRPFTYNSLRDSKNQDFGGFPMPSQIIKSIFAKLFPKLNRRLTRTVTIPMTQSLVPSRMDEVPPGAKPVTYISFDAIVGHNSTFHLLTSDQLTEIGGVEYRALNALLWIVGCYHIGVQLFCFTVIAPYIAQSRWKDTFLPPQQIRPVNSTWFSIFQVVSSYTNTGTSLVDQSMLPFQTAYPMIILMIFLILAGNTSFPIFLRFTIWILSKLVSKTSRANETLHFLLDHPRRCFIYLFPSHQTWFLLTIVLTLTFTDWFFFMLLDIGNNAIDQIPLNVRFLAGFLQAVAVRAAGFGIVPLASLAPAVKVLYAIMMYISVYPIAMSVRSTNVYEEQSLGIFNDNDDDSNVDRTFEPTGHRMTVWSRYVAMHARRQLAFDMWWLALALFLVCIIERGAITDEANWGWLNIFTIIFELVSAYGTVGLSLGIPNQNYSLSGAFRPLSKLIVCAVMLRGRHRGLPVAIDRAVLLPSEFERPILPEDGGHHPSQYNVNESPGDRYNGDPMDDAVSESTRWKRHSVRQMSSEDLYRPSQTGQPAGSQDTSSTAIP